MNDHIIRILLEGRTNLNKVLGEARKDLDEFVRYAKNKDRELQNTAGFGGKSVRGPGGLFMSEEEARRIGLFGKTLKQDVREIRDSFVSGFREARKESQIIEAMTEAAAKRRAADMQAFEDKANKIIGKQDQKNIERIAAARQAAIEENQIRDKQIESLKASRKQITDEALKAEHDAIMEEIKLRERALEDEIAKKQADQRETIIRNQQEANKLQRQGVQPERVAKLRSDADDIRRELARQREDDKANLEVNLASQRAAAEDIRNRNTAQVNKEIELLRTANSQNIAEREKAARHENGILSQGLKERISILRQHARERSTAEADVGTSVRDIRRERLRDLEPMDRLATTAGTAFADFGRGARAAAGDLEGWGKAARRTQPIMARLGFATLSLVASFGELVNIRWAIMIGALGTIITLLVQVGAALAAVAASAAQAGAALGGALVAGIGQALPMIGLLAGALNNLKGAMNVVELRQAARDAATTGAEELATRQRSAANAVADAQYGLARAHEAVTDAMVAQGEAAKALADARVAAAKAIRDAALEERDAELAVKEAELDLLDAKQKLKAFTDRERTGPGEVEQARAQVAEAQARLALAQSRGDFEGISQTTADVMAAENNLRSLLEQLSGGESEQRVRLGVQRAQLDLERARNRRTDARQENAQRQAQGIEGSPEVVAAQKQAAAASRQLRDARHGVTMANRALKDAELGVANATIGNTAAAEKAKIEWDKLSDAQKEQVLALEKLMDVWKKNSPAFLDPITRGITAMIQSIIDLLRDPEIKAALVDLGKAMGEGFKEFAKFLRSDEGRSAFLFFIREAAKNVPKIADGLLDIVKLLIRVGQAANPIFNSILGRFLEWIGMLEKMTRPVSNLDKGLKGIGDRINDTKAGDSPLFKFFREAGTHLDTFLRLGVAVGQVFLAFAQSPAKDTGNSLIESLAGTLEKFAQWIKDNPDDIREFFENIEDGVKRLGRIFLNMIRMFGRIASSPEFLEFTEFFMEVLIPAVLDAIRVIGLIIKIINFLIDLPFVGWIIKTGIQLIVFGGILTKIFPLISKLSPLIRFLIYTFGLLWDALAWGMKQIWRFVNWAIDQFARFGKFVGGVLDKMDEQFDRFVKWLEGLGGKIASAFSGLGTFFSKLGASLWDGMKRGFADMLNWVIDKVNFVIRAANKLPKVNIPEIGLIYVNRDLSDADRRAAEGIQSRAAGGPVDGPDGHPVPILAHAGEWVLNKVQQMKLSKVLGVPPEAIAELLFGGLGIPDTGASKSLSEKLRGARTMLTNKFEDDFGETVFFARLKDGSYAQVLKKTYDRINATGIPYGMRRLAGFAGGGGGGGRFMAMAMGGVVQPLQSFAAGGTVRNIGARMAPGARTEVNQSFTVHTASPTIDIDYIMRKGGIHAAGAY